jgi:hypothetical protein
MLCPEETGGTYKSKTDATNRPEFDTITAVMHFLTAHVSSAGLSKPLYRGFSVDAVSSNVGA